MSNNSHNFILKNDGTIWGAGTNTYWQLGLGDTTNRTTFTQVNVDNVKSVACGSGYTVLLKNDGTLWAIGENDKGQLGLGNTTNRTTFTKVDIDNVESISCGTNHISILKNDGTLWTTGFNYYGALGLGNTTNRTTFTKVDIDNVKSIYCGAYHTVLLKNDGTLWATGYNALGQLGLGDTTDRTTFTQVNVDNVKSASCGASYLFIIKNDGTVWATGRNSSGQLGLGDTTDRATFTKVDITDVKSVSCGDSHTLILKNDGTGWITGQNTFGQLGLGDTINRSIFTKVNVADIKSVYCGVYHTFVLKNDGTIWATGRNNYGQLGLGDATQRNVFTKVAIDNVKSIFDEMEIIIESFLYLIKTLQSKYTIDKDSKVLSEITDILTAEIINAKGINMDTINESIDILPDEFSLISDKEFDLVIHGLKDNGQMVIASNDFLTTIKEHVDYFKSESTTTETSKIKVVFSIDGGLTWKTYQDGVIVDTSIKIPCKDFNILTEQELEQWNLAKSEIILNGIDASVLETIDFNTIQFDKIRFAYAMSVEDIDDVASLSKLIWQFDSKGSMRQLKNTEYSVKIHADKVEFNSLINTDMIKVNIYPDGIGVSDDISFATEDEIALLFN